MTFYDILEQARQQYPYAVPGKGETWNNYNEGWQDAINYIDMLMGRYPEIDEFREG